MLSLPVIENPIEKTIIMKKLAVALAFILCPLAVSAQRVVSDTYTYSYVMSDTETLKQAEVKAVKQAQLKMIADNFGTLVSQTTALAVSDDVESITYGEVEVKGEWLSDNAAPKIRKSVANDHFVLEVTVSGKIRELVSVPIDLKCHVLKNGTDDRYASTDFKHGDRLYMSFKSPVDGYLAVYLGDMETVNCLFPYNGSSMDIMKVSGGEEYILFSKANPGSLDPFAISEYPLGCSPGNTMEMVRLYVVFSPNKFTKANDNADGRLRSLPFEDFHTWMSKVRRMDTEMNLISSDIVIRRK